MPLYSVVVEVEVVVWTEDEDEAEAENLGIANAGKEIGYGNAEVEVTRLYGSVPPGWEGTVPYGGSDKTCEDLLAEPEPEEEAESARLRAAGVTPFPGME